MHAALGLLAETERLEGGPDDVLEVGLPDIDHVEDFGGTSEVGRVPRTSVRSRHPERVRAKCPERRVPEIPAFQQPELPQLVSDVLAHVGNGSVRANDYLVCVRFLGAIRSPPSGAAARRDPKHCRRHYPAAGVLARCLEPDRFARLQQLECRGPETQLQDLALARQHVVGNANPLHRRQVASHYGVADDRADRRELSLAGLERLQCLDAPCERVGIPTGEQARDLGIQVPAVVIETHLRVARQSPHLVNPHVPQESKRRHHVRNLHAGVVDVVLDFDAPPERPQHAHEGVSEHGVAQVADMCGLVRVDVRVLDDCLGGIGGRLVGSGKDSQRVSRSVKAHVDVPGARDLERPDTGNARKLGHQLGSDLARSASQRLREAEADRRG